MRDVPAAGRSSPAPTEERTKMHQPTALDAASAGGWSQRIPDQQIVSSLRGPKVEVDVRRVGRVVVGLSLAALTVTAIVLLVAGFQTNAQITQLKTRGVEVPVTVSGCLGQLGGSGSNAAGYACTGTYVFGGHLYRQALPGPDLKTSGSVVRGIIDPADPRLLSTPATLAGEQTSWSFLVLPILLLVVVAAGIAVLVARRRTASDPVEMERWARD